MATRAKHKDAIALLKADHRAVEMLFKQYATAGSPSKKRRLATQICTDLIVHTTVEEEVFYPACRGEVKVNTLDEAYVEHDGAKVMISELLSGSPDDPFYDAKMKVLSEEIKHHVHEEEMRDGLFAQARNGGVDVVELGQRIAGRKAELIKQSKQCGTPPPETRSFHGGKLKRGGPVAIAKTR